MSNKEKIEMLQASYSAHGIKTEKDFERYCRPHWCLFVGVSVFACIFTAALYFAIH